MAIYVRCDCQGTIWWAKCLGILALLGEAPYVERAWTVMERKALFRLTNQTAYFESTSARLGLLYNSVRITIDMHVKKVNKKITLSLAEVTRC